MVRKGAPASVAARSVRRDRFSHGYYPGVAHSNIASRVRDLSGWRHVAALAATLFLSFVVGLGSVLPVSGPSTLS